MKNKMFFLYFAVLLFSVTVRSQSTVSSTTPAWNKQFQQTAPSVQVPKKLTTVDVYLTNYSLLSVTVRLTNVDDNTEYMFYPITDFPVSSTTVYVGSVLDGTYNVEIGDYGPSPIIKNGKTECDLDYNKHGEPLFWWNHYIGGCSSFTIVKALL